MRTQIASVLKQPPQLKKFVCRNLTTTSDPRKSFGLALNVKDEIPQIGSVQDALLPSLALPNADLFSYSFLHAKKWQDKTFTECSITGRNYTFGQTIDGALRWASALKKLLPNEPNPTVAFISLNSPEYVTMFYGCLAAGVTVSPINPGYTPDEIANHLKDSGASLLVVDSIVEPLADAAFQYLGKSLPVVVNGLSKSGRPNAMEVLMNPTAPMADPIDIDPSSIAFLPYSSGTTGKPKGVKISHAAITNNMSMCINEYITCMKPSEGNYQEVQLGVLPFFHIYGMMATLLSSVFYGNKLVTMPKFDPALLISTVKKHKFSSLQVVPSLLQFFAECPMITKKDLDGLSSFNVGGSPVSPALAVLLKEKCPTALFQEGYGMTETLLTHVTARDGEKIGYCGQLLCNTKAKVVDIETGDILPPNTPGELCIKTPSVMSGYHNNEEATREVLTEDGWISTGDVAIYTEDGYFSIVDRLKELIKVKGLQVSPTELEEAIQIHPGVADVGIVGIPHPRFGEVPAAFVVRSDPDLKESTIHKLMQERFSKHKQLEGGITFVDELPKNMMGKLLRRVLKGMAMKNN